MKLSFSDEKFVEEEIDRLLRQGSITPSQSHITSPIVVVNKKNGSKRLCINYRRLNEELVIPHMVYSDPRKIRNELALHKYMNTYDLKDGFFHVPLHENDMHKTAFVTSMIICT